MSNADTIFAVVISGTPFEPEKWSYTDAERDEIVRRCHDEGHIESFLVSDNLKAMGAKPPRPHPMKKQPAIVEPPAEPAIQEIEEAHKPATDHASLIDAVIAAKAAVKKASGAEEKAEAVAKLKEAKAALAASK
jgi:hypothetical protein